MKYYMAQIASFLQDATRLFSYIHDHALLCYYDEKKYARNMIEWYPHILIDSGAFSASTIGAKIDINEYCSFLQMVKDKVDGYVNLDAIGDAKKSQENQKFMEKQGLEPIPVYHSGEDLKYLDDYCGSYDYIGLGGVVGTKNTDRWLEVIFNKYPTKKFHGFGITSPLLLKKYPFYSVDSTSWCQTAGLGMVLFQDGITKHYNELNQEDVIKLNRLGFSLENIKKHYVSRCFFNLSTIKSFCLTDNIQQKDEFRNVMEEVS